ncbi:MAG TPA: PfkB family carbohydrate kinase [Planctomycetaceae bacterium]|nr:PfkB family carbohydrate kinase [Planctomycetaceae bacterium]
MKRDRLEELLARFASRRVAVLGDFFLDKYLEVDPKLAETSVETGKTANQVVEIRTSPGAAGTVVNNLAALGARELHAIGATGDDGEAYDLRRGLEAQHCSITALVPFPFLHTPTYLKPRNANDPSLAGEHERYDTKNRRATPAAVGERLLSELDRLLPQIDVLIIADQVEQTDCGVITGKVRAAIAERARQHPKVHFWADSRTHICEFRNVIIKPNQFEAVGHLNPRPGETVPLPKLRDAIPHLRAAIGAPVCCTRGAEGMIVSDPEVTAIPGVKLTGPIDATGAGDSATAGAVLALASGATLPEAALIGCLVASITVQQLATTGTATPDQVLERLEMWREQNS